MHFWIDGYNFLFHMAPNEDDLRTHRDAFIERLVSVVDKASLNVTVVFDAQYQESDILRRHQGDLEIIFTAHGETADDYLIRRFHNLRHPRNNTLVTNDMRLAWRARQSDVKIQTIREFLHWFLKHRPLKKPLQGTPPPVVEPQEPQDGSLEYYLQAFQIEEIVHEAPIVKKKTMSDYQRWLQAFEREETQEE